jgi:hypothetical protein
MRTHAAVLGLAFFAFPAVAQTSFPMITHVSPTAVQRGTTAEVEVAGQQNFAGPHKVLVEGTGVTAVVETKPVARPKVEAKAKSKAKSPAPVRSVTIRFTIAPDAPLGVREFRIASDLGISSLGQLVVVADPVLVEKPGLNTAAKAMKVPVPAVVCGRIETAENVDYYKFTAKAGQVLTFEVYCARIQDKIHDLQKHADPLVRVFAPDGRELAAADDDFFADPVLTLKAPADGEYVVEVRDATYAGDPRWTYALAITDRPFATHSFPLAASPGQTIPAEPVGSAKEFGGTFSLHAPSLPGLHAVPLRGGGTETNPVPVVVTPLKLVSEAEPNDSLAQATRLPLPGGVNGRIQVRRDLDYYVFTGKKDQMVRLEVFARRFGTPLCSRTDAALDVMTPDGKVLAASDDVNGKDPRFHFTPSADGDHVVRIRDLNNKGGDGFVYYLEADIARPDFTLKCDPSKAMIGPGSRTAWYVQVTRSSGFTGPVKVEVKGLPKGVTASPLTIPANMTQGCLVLTAADDAKPDAAVVQVVGSGPLAPQAGSPSLTRTATPVEEIYFPGGGRGRFDVGMQAVAVTGPSDLLEVKPSTNKVVLKPGQDVTINVTVKRRADYDKPVTLDVHLRHLGQIHGTPLPPGVTLVEGKSKTLLGTGSTGTITLRAAPDAPECADVPVAIQGYVAVNFVVKIGYASEPIWVSVQKK